MVRVFSGDLTPSTPYLDASGRPRAGAQMRFFRSGTHQPITVTTQAGIEVSQPLVADAQGVFSQVYADEPCRVLLQDAAGRLVFDVDPVPVGNAVEAVVTVAQHPTQALRGYGDNVTPQPETIDNNPFNYGSISPDPVLVSGAKLGFVNSRWPTSPGLLVGFLGIVTHDWTTLRVQTSGDPRSYTRITATRNTYPSLNVDRYFWTDSPWVGPDVGQSRSIRFLGDALVSPVYQARSNGRPVPGGVLEFFAGDVRAAIFADADRKVALPNPISADAGGFFPVIYLPDEAVTYTASWE